MSDIFGGQESAGFEVQTGSEKPLTDEERALLQRLLSDPFSYPQQFKTWLVAYLEGSDLLLARSSVQGLSDLLGSGGGSGVLGLLPAGMIFPYGGAVAPVGSYLCNGAAYSRVGAKRLFDVIGALYGAGDGSTTFNVPDLRRRLPFGAGAGIGLGVSDGKVEASRHIDHHHGFSQTSNTGGAHSHGGSTGGVGDHQHAAVGDHNHASASGQFAIFSGGTAALGSGGSSRNLVSGGESATQVGGGHQHAAAGAHSHGITADAGHTHVVAGDTQGGFETNHPSYLTVGFIINY